MLNLSRTALSGLLTLFLFISAFGQTPPPTRLPTEAVRPSDAPALTQLIQPTTVLITATATSQRVRYISIGEVHQTRLQVFSADGMQVFDSAFTLGNLIDWQLQDQQGAHLSDGSYLFLVTAQDFSGNLTQKYGAAQLDQLQVSLQQATRDELTAAQANALEANKLSATLSAVDRIGVTGTAPGPTADSTAVSPQTSAREDQEQRTTAGASTTNISGTGLPNQLAKWVDSAGTLGDSSVFEAGGRIGIGTSVPGAKFHVVGAQGSLSAGTFQLDTPTLFSSFTSAYPAFELLNTDQTNNNISLFQFSDAPSGASHAGIGAVSTNHTNKFGNLFFYTKGTDGYQVRMGIFGGNVGLGTTTPNHHLSINGGPLWTSNSWSGAVELTNGSALGWQANSGGQRFGIGQSTGGLYFFRTASNPGTIASPANYAMVISDSGKVGIGTLTPTTQLYVTSGVPSVSAIYGESTSGRGVWGKSVGSRGVFGEADNGEGVHGQSNTGNGVVGGSTMGTGVYGESAAANNAAQAGVYGRGTGSGGVGMTGEANVGNAVGVLGLSSSANGFALYARNTGGGYGLYSENNVGQNRDKGGFVKAMIYVDANGTIAQCFNSFLSGSAASTGNCGFAVNHTLAGDYLVNFNFKVNDRFVSITPKSASGVNIGATFSFSGLDSTTIIVNTFITDVDYIDSFANNPFMLILY